jgi:methyltransferase-like protein
MYGKELQKYVLTEFERGINKENIIKNVIDKRQVREYESNIMDKSHKKERVVKVQVQAEVEEILLKDYLLKQRGSV